MSDNHTSIPQPAKPNPNDRKFRRFSYSDHSMPGVLFIAVFVVLIVTAILYVGYRVFKLESDRFELNEIRKDIDADRQLLEGKKELLEEARQVSSEVRRLKTNHNSVKAELDELTDNLRQVEARKDSLRVQVDRANAELSDLRNRLVKQHTKMRKLKADEDDQLVKLQDLKRQKDSELKEVEALLQIRKKMESLDRELSIDIAKLEARKKTLAQLTEDQSLINSIGEDLTLILPKLHKSVGSVDKEVTILHDAATRLEADADGTLTVLKKNIVESTATFNKHLGHLQSAVVAIDNVVDPIDKARAELNQASAQLKQASESATQSFSSSSLEIASVIESFKSSTHNEFLKFSTEVSRGREQISLEVSALAKSVEQISDAASTFGVASDKAKKIDSLVSTFEGLNKHIASITSRVASIVDELDQKKLELADSVESIAELKEPLRGSRQHLDTLTNDLRQSISLFYTTANQELTKSTQELSTALISISGDAENLKKAISLASSNAPKLEKAQIALGRLIKQFEGVFESTTKDLPTTAQALIEITESLTQQKRLLARQITNLDDEMAKLVNVRNELEQTPESIREAGNEIRTVAQGLSQEFEGHEAQLATLQTKISQYESAVGIDAELIATLIEVKTEYEQLRQTSSQLEEQIRDLAANLSTGAADYKREMNAATVELNTVVGKLLAVEQSLAEKQKRKAPRDNVDHN